MNDSDLCTCGHSKGEHDTSDPIEQPCTQCGCSDFDEDA